MIQFIIDFLELVWRGLSDYLRLRPLTISTAGFLSSPRLPVPGPALGLVLHSLGHGSCALRRPALEQVLVSGKHEILVKQISHATGIGLPNRDCPSGIGQ